MLKRRKKKTVSDMMRTLAVLLAASLLLAVVPVKAYAGRPITEDTEASDVTVEEAVAEDMVSLTESETAGEETPSEAPVSDTEEAEPAEDTTEDLSLNAGEGGEADTTIDTKLTLESDQTISGNVVVNADVSLNGHTLHITGDFRHLYGKVNFNEGTLLIDGNYIAQSTGLDTNGKNNPSYGTLDFEEDSDTMVVGGDFLAQSQFSSTMKAGTLELKGNVTDLTGNTVRAGALTPGSTHVAVFSGTKKQVVELDGGGYCNGTLIIELMHNLCYTVIVGDKQYIRRLFNGSSEEESCSTIRCRC